VFRREKLLCVRCHAIGGAGGVTGPDLTSIGGSAQLDYLVESVLQPSAQIKEGYDTLTVLLTDGTLEAGVVAERTEEELVLRDSNGEEIFIYPDEIDAEKVSAVSVMPVGLVAELARPDFLDLVAFLSQLGKEGGLRVGPERLVRSWLALDATPEVGALLRARGVQAPARDPDAFPWKTVTSTVTGGLPLVDVPAGEFFAGQRFRVLRFGLTSPAAGPALLRLSSAEGVEMFLDGEPVEARSETVLELPAGPATVTLILEQGRFSAETLTVELSDAEGSPARAELAREL
jgi:putative heme-binding domain-containing protein